MFSRTLRKHQLLLVRVACFGLLISSSASAQGVSPASSPSLPTRKQTTLGLYVTAREGYEKWKTAPDQVMVIDVRTPEEFIFVGHPDMAWSIPFAIQSYQWDSTSRSYAMRPLPDFVERVRRIADTSVMLLVTCRSGERGAMAVNALARAGFTKVYNITDGVEGDVVKDAGSVFIGQRLVNGWKNSGLPWTYAIDPDRIVLSAVNQ